MSIEIPNQKNVLVLLSGGQGVSSEGMFLPYVEALDAPFTDPSLRITHRTLYEFHEILSGLKETSGLDPEEPIPAELLDDTVLAPQITVTHQLLAQASLAGLGMRRPDVSIGTSLGGITAGVAAGVIDFSTAQKMAKLRGEACETAISNSGIDGVMFAYNLRKSRALGGGVDLPNYIDQTCKYLNLRLRKDGFENDLVVVSNINSSSQVVTSGSAYAQEELDRLVADPNIADARRLLINGAYHSPYMSPARESFEEGIKDLTPISDSQNALISATKVGYVEGLDEFFNESAGQLEEAVDLRAAIQFLIKIIQDNDLVETLTIVEAGPCIPRDRTNTSTGVVIRNVQSTIGQEALVFPEQGSRKERIVRLNFMRHSEPELYVQNTRVRSPAVERALESTHL